MTGASPDGRVVSFEPEAKDEALVAAAMARLTAAVEKVEFVLDQESRRFLKLDGPIDKFFNLTPAQLLADTDAWRQSVPAFDSAATADMRSELKRDKFIFRTVRATGSDGRMRFLRGSFSLLEAQGRTLVAGSVVEVESEGDAQQPWAAARNAVEEAHEGVAVTDAAGCYLYLNREHVEIFGYSSADELIGKSWRTLYLEEDAQRIEQTVFPELTTKGRWRGRLQAKRKDGSLFQEALLLTLLPSGGLVCNCRDATEQVELAGRLDKAEALFRLFLNTLSTGVTIRNLRGDYEFVNAATAKFLALQQNARGGPTKLVDCLREEKVFTYWGAVDQRVGKTGAAERFDFPLSWGGRDWILYVEKLPLRIGSSDVTHVCTLIQDVTEQRRLQAQTSETARRLDEYLVMQREFISMVSHEFRTPLTAIQGLQYLMDRGLKESTVSPPTAMPRWIALQGEALQTLRYLVDQVVLLNRIESLASAVPLAVPLHECLLRLLKDVASSLETPRLKWRLDVPREYIAQIHEPQLRALVNNLISNGLKYSSGDVTVTVRIHEANWSLAVADVGRGVPLADQAKLFRPFYRASNIGSVPGTGLGLAIVQRCVAFHRGTVGLESREGLGSIFTITLPQVLPEHNDQLPYLERLQTTAPFLT